MLSISEHASSQYRNRTQHNVDVADLTVAFATDYGTPGERLTRNLAGRRYVAIPLMTPVDDAAAQLLRYVRSLGVKTLNVAGNSIRTLRDEGLDQASVNAWVHAVLQQVHEMSPLSRIVTGGQTGVDLAGGVAGVALEIPTVMTLPKGFLQRDAAGEDHEHSAADIERQVMRGVMAFRPDLVPDEPKAMKWVDLSSIGVYVGAFQGGHKDKGMAIVDTAGKYDKQIRSLGFVPAAGQFGHGVYVRDSMAIDTGSLGALFGDANVKWVSRTKEEIAQAFSGKVAEKTRMNADAFFAQEKPLGLNHLSEMVYEGIAGRFILRRGEDGRGVMVREGTAGDEPAAFLRAADADALAKVAYGFVRRILRREYLRREDVRALIEISNQGGFSERDYQEYIEAAVTRLFQEETAKHGKTGLGAFNVANRLYTAMPSLTVRTSNSVANQQYSTPVPMAALGQALLTPSADLKGASVLEPTIGNASLVSLLSGGEIYGVEIDDERISRLPDNVTQCVHGDATEVNFRAVFGKPEGFDFVIANPPFGSLEERVEVALPTGSLGTEMATKRLDHLILLQSLHARKPNGRAVFITGADSVMKEGEVKGRSQSLLNYLYDHYEVAGVVDVAGELYKKQGAAFPQRLYVIGNRREVPVESTEVPEQLPVIRTYEGLRGWAAKVLAGEAIENIEGVEIKPRPQAPVRDEGPRADSVLDLLKEEEGQPPQAAAEGSESSGVEEEPKDDDREDNEFQQRYIAFSKVAEPTTMIPANLSGPIYEALARIQEKHGDIDEFVGRCLKYSIGELEEYFSPEQVDALAMVFDAHDRGLGFLLADKMGVGKGRVLAAVARRERLEGRIPTFITIGANLFTDFLERDLADIGSRELFKKPFLVNDGSATLDASGDVAVKAMKREEYRKYAEAAELPEGTDIVMLTYSQLSRRAASHLTSRYLGNLAEKYPLSLLLDEAHMGAGASNTSENLEYMIDSLASRGRVIYSSGTPIKGAKNLRLYKRILPEGINHEELLAAVQADPLSLQEALNYEIAAQGCLICRELDDAGINRDFVPSEDLERNRQIADQMAEILSAMSFLSGDVKKMVIKLNKEFEKELERIPEADREGQRMGASSMNFGSRLHQINRQFLLALKAKDVVRLTLAALEDNRKPIISLQHTGESLLVDFVTRANEQYLEDDGRVQKTFGAVTLEQPVTFRDLMHKYLERIMTIKVMARYGDYSSRRVSSEEADDAAERIKILIDALPDDLPLTPLDYVRDELAKHGYTVGEISGRNLQAIPTDSGGVSIEPVPNRGDKTRIVKTARAFNNGDIDVLMITESGSTGLSVQASPAVGRDVRRRRMVKWEMQADVAKERQMDGRPNRTGQLYKPDYQIPMTGLPADDRQAMMFNNKNRNLTASTVANRDSREIIREVPDLLNVVGDQVAYELLYSKPDLARHLDIELPEGLDDVWIKPALYWINKLTGRISLLRVAEQEAMYAELQSRFLDELDKLKAEGRNPLEVSCHDWKASQLARERYMGQANESKKLSSFNDAIYLTTVEYQQEMRAVRADEIDKKIATSIEALAPLGVKRAEDVHYKHVVTHLQRERGAILQRHLGRRYVNIVQALEDKNPNEVKNVDAKMAWLVQNLPNLGYGTVFYDNELDGSRSPRVVVGVSAPAAADGYLRLSDWRVTVMRPGAEQVAVMTFGTLYSKGVELQKWRFRDNPPVRMIFDRAENGIVTKRARLLDGNLFEAVAMNLRTRIGSKVVYTDDKGSRQHGILVHSHISDRKLWEIPERVRDAQVLADVVSAGAPITDHSAGECFGKEGKHAVVLMRNQSGLFELRVSSTKMHGGHIFTDPVLTSIKGKEHECRFRLNFAEFSGKMSASIPADRLHETISYLVARKNIDFYVKDRETLEKVRGCERDATNERDAQRTTSAACC